ncbi:hypothetical protein [Paenibacillus lignilyticus]|uniref:Ferric siderophore reductase C-terminal domain-containing protein n=1 Tax=Paenibacillus lignilyticus TaxID=1172615 RepID=A0ABS5CDT7_9BACL|nr:hypothetical protein [Paenibacillus lignilyticus]MBP3963283.1 hypothetical protein [Paenibacillus lignilyticus]
MMNEPVIDFSQFDSYYIRVSPTGAATPSFEMPATDFSRVDAVKKAIEIASLTARATGPELAASFIGGSLFNLCKARLLLLSRYNILLDMSLDKLTFQMEDFGTYNMFGYKLHEVRYTVLPDDADRGELVRDALEADFRDVVGPILNALASAGNLKPAVIWMQFGSMLANMITTFEAKETHDAVRERFAHDCKVLTEQLEPGLFGSRRNPFAHKPRYVDSPYQLGGKTMIRSGCCMYHCREDGDMCYNCPKLTTSQREERYARIVGAS